MLNKFCLMMTELVKIAYWRESFSFHNSHTIRKERMCFG